MKLGLTANLDLRKKRSKRGGFVVELFKDVFTNQIIFIDSVPELSESIRLRREVFYCGRNVTALTKNLVPLRKITITKWYEKENKMRQNCASIKYYLSGEQIKTVKRGTDEAYSDFSCGLTFIEG